MRQTPRIRIFVMLLLCCTLFACGSVQEQWGKLSPDEQGRIIAGSLQDNLQTTWAAGTAYVARNPQYQEEWTQKIVPAFDVANKSLATYMTLMQDGKIAPDELFSKMSPLVKSVTDMLKAIGVSL
jgi:hypothetical protein